MPKDYRKYARAARKAGWAIHLNGSGHVVFRGPDGAKATVPGSGHRSGHSARNYIAELRRAGVPGLT